jgi:hypothetical protein
VTAVTTAGLLAGLFGSAFVPAARAAAPTVAVTAGNADGSSASAKTYYFLSSVNPQVIVTAADTDGNDGGSYQVTVTGTTILTCAASGTSTLVTTVIGPDTCTATVTMGAATQTVVMTLSLKKLAAGSSATISLTGPSDADNSTALTLDYTTMTSVASTAGSTVANATESAKEFKMNSNGNVTKGETADVADEVIGGVDYFLPAQNLKKAVYAGRVSNQYGTTTGHISIIAEVSNSNFAVGCDASVDGTAATSSATIQQITATAGVFECQVYSDGAASAGGAWTLSIRTTITGTVVGTASGAFYGEVASITAAFYDGDRAPEVAGAEVNNFISVVIKDANGKQYGLAEVDAISATAKVLTAYGTVAGGTTAGAQTLTEGTLVASKNTFKLDVDFCAAGSTGKTASVQVANVNGTGTSIKSNTLTVQCGAAVADALTIQKIEFEKSNPLPGESFDVYVYLEDADGVLAGAGDGVVDFGLSLTGATEEEANWNGTTVDATDATPALTELTDGYGRMVFTIKAPATVGTVITVSDPASSAIAKVYTTNDAYEGVLSVGPKKLKATADFGPAAAKKKVAFVLESAAGVTKTYYRRANASGVASYTLALRGTWTVYATFGDEISDTGTMRR